MRSKKLSLAGMPFQEACTGGNRAHNVPYMFVRCRTLEQVAMDSLHASRSGFGSMVRFCGSNVGPEELFAIKSPLYLLLIVDLGQQSKS